MYNQTLKNIPIRHQNSVQDTLYIKNNYLSIVDLGNQTPRPRSRKPYAFYMPYLCLRYEHKQDQSHQLMPYPLKFRKSYEEKLKLFPILLCHFIKRFGTRAFGDISFLPLWPK